MKRELRVGKKGVFVLIIISVLLLVYQLKQISYYRLRGTDTDNTSPESSFYRTSVESKLELARLNHYFLYSDFENNLKLYANALELNPVYLQAWISLVELLIHNRSDDEAKTVLNYVYEITGLSINELWDISILALKLNDTELGVRNLVEFSRAVPFYERERAYNIIEKLDKGPELFVKYANDPSSVINYFNYTINKNMHDSADYLWNYMDNNSIKIDKESELKFVNYLISRNDLERAFSIWNNIYPGEKSENKNLVWNGGFESEIINKGFDWNISEVDGVDVEIDDEMFFGGGKSLKITFSGKDNVNYGHASQIIPVKGRGDYVFEFAYSSRNISTRSGLYVQLRCTDGSGREINTDMILGNNNWKKHKLYFTIDDDCSGIKLTLRRNRINKLDNKIKGTVWLDDFSLTETG